MFNKLRNIFNIDNYKSSPARQDEKFCVNYMWISKDTKPLEDAMCTVPLRLLDVAYENARFYPEAEFNIWIDKAMIDPLSDFFVLSHGFLTAPDNINFRNLRDVPTIFETDIFSVESPQKIWARVDLARLLVLDHLLETSDKEYQLYSDFDVKDVLLGDEHMLSSLNKHGLFFGTTMQAYMLENGYMCDDKKAGKDFLHDKLIPRTVDDTKNGFDGWHAISYEYDAWRTNKLFLDGNTFAKGPRLEVMGYEVPDNPLYKDSGLN